MQRDHKLDNEPHKTAICNFVQYTFQNWLYAYVKKVLAYVPQKRTLDLYGRLNSIAFICMNLQTFTEQSLACD